MKKIEAEELKQAREVIRLENQAIAEDLGTATPDEVIESLFREVPEIKTKSDALRYLVRAVDSVSTSSTARTINTLAGEIFQIAKAHGWWEGERNDGELIALMHSELSEALEGLRHGNPASEHIPNFTAIEEEFADVIIRILDMSFARGLNIGAAILAKMEFNRNRPYKHGGKKF